MRSFVLFALPRTGSTTLARLLRLHPSVRLIGEPFHPRLHDGRWAREARERGVPSAMESLWREYNAVKHVADPYGWPFSDGGAGNAQVLACGATVVLLRRRNVLRRLVSLQLAEQTDVWSIDTPEARRQLLDRAPKPLNVAALRDELARERSLTWRGDVEIWYEDLFGETLEVGTRLERVGVLLASLGLSPLEPTGDVVRLLDPVAVRMNDRDSYLRIPNVGEVEAALGSDETGWLFPGESSSHAGGLS